MAGETMNEDIGIIESIREIEKLSRKAEERVLKKTETGITLRLAECDDIYEKYSNYRDKQISHEILEYLEDQIKYVPVYSQIKISIETENDESTMIENVRSAVRNHLRVGIIEKQIEMTQNLKEFIVLLVLGVASFGIKAILNKYISNVSVNEILLIVAWVFIWRAVETFYFERRRIRKDKLKLIQLFMAKYNRVGEETQQSVPL
jgi:hypothetical protein